MKHLKLQGLALASLIVISAAPMAQAEYKKVAPDKRSQAQIAEDECEAQSNGSRQVIVGAVLGGIIGQAIGRDSYVKDCMKARGYEKVRPQKKPSQKRRSRDG
jgi:hypothetical protein